MTIDIIIGIISAVFVSIAFIPQAVKLIKNRGQFNGTLITNILYIIGLALMIISVAVSPNLNKFFYVIIANTSALLFNLVIVFLTVKQRLKKKGKK